jgi:UDP:flavonoid glycosyltransferase YjiC (YdhE family)
MGPVKIMFASLGAYGHLYLMMPLALASAAAGHETVIAVGPPFLGRLPLPTVPGYPPELELDWAIQEARRRHPDLHDQEFSMAMFADVAAENVAPTMIKQCEQLRPDLVIYEGMDTGAGVAASVLGIPAAAYATALASFLYSALKWPTTSPTLPYRHGYPDRTCGPGSISPSAPCQSARSTYSAVRLLRSRHSAWTSW